MKYDVSYIFAVNKIGEVQAPISVICDSNYRKLLSHVNYPLILQMSCVNSYLIYTVLRSVSIQIVIFSLSALQPRPLPPRLPTLINGSWLGMHIHREMINIHREWIHNLQTVI